MEFDVYLLDTDAIQPFELASCQLGFLLNSSIYNGGILSVAIINTGSGLNPDQQFASAPDVVSSLPGYPGQTLIRLAANSGPPVPPGAGDGTIISTSGNGTLLTHFTLTSTVDFTANSTPNLIFCSSSVISPLYPTKVNAYIAGLDTPITVTPGINAIVVGNPILNETLPVVFNVMGGGSYCEGGPGLPVGLDGSEAGVTYTLYLGAAVIGTETGTGSAISFGNQTIPGTYTVEGTNSGGTTAMDGDATITVNPLPTAAGTITGAAAVCQGQSGVGYSVGMIPNATSYTWIYSGAGAMINGSSNAVTISFDATATSGNLTVYGVNACGNGTISANYPVAVNANLPVSVSIAAVPSGAVCTGTSVTYTATPTNGGTTPSYQWQVNGANVGTSLTTYSYTPVNGDVVRCILTSNAPCATGSPATSNSITMTVNPLPAAAGAITGTAAVCQGATSVSYSVPAITNAASYTWSYSGTGATISGSTSSITINFAANATSGNLTVYGTNTCGNGTVSENYPIVVNAVPTITGTTPGSRCGTGAVTLGATASAGMINWYAAASGGVSLGTGTSYTTGSISLTTTYYVDATDGGCTTATRTAVIATINTIPTITGTTPGSRCGTGTVILGRYSKRRYDQLVRSRFGRHLPWDRYELHNWRV